jgi:hypothetical protein
MYLCIRVLITFIRIFIIIHF